MIGRRQILARERRMLAELLMDQCQISVQSTVVGTMRTQSKMYNPVQSTVCRMLPIQRTTSDVVVGGGQESLEQQYKVILPHGTTIDLNYRIAVNGVNYNVVRIDDARTDALDVQVIVVVDR